MRPEDYPAQEPFTAIGARYHDEVLRRGAGIEGVEHSYGPDAYQSLAIYPAEKPSGIVLAVMHGGGWTNGYKEWMAFMAPALGERGVTLVSIGYRLAPANLFPAQFEDVADGLAAAWAKVGDHGGDPQRLFAGGHSAGGHLAALAASRRDWQVPRSLPADTIKGALPISGTYWFGEDSGLSMRPRFLGPEGSGTEAAASPIRFVDRAVPPMLVAWGSRDFPHLQAQARAYASALNEAGATVETIILDGCDHLGASYASGDPGSIWLARAADFMARHAPA